MAFRISEGTLEGLANGSLTLFPDVGILTGDVFPPAGDVGALTADVEALTSNLDAPTFNVEALTFDIGGLTFDIGALTSDVGGLTFDIFWRAHFIKTLIFSSLHQFQPGPGKICLLNLKATKNNN